MNKNREECIKLLREEILFNKEKLLENEKILEILQKEEIITEEIWCKISNILPKNVVEIILKDIFSEATEVEIYPTYISFYLNDFKCLMFTNNYDGIYIDTSWYQKRKDLSSLRPSDLCYLKMDYSEDYYQDVINFAKAKRNKTSWVELAILRSKFCYKKDNYSKLELFFLWFFIWKWEGFDENLWLTDFEESTKLYNLTLDKNKKLNKLIYEKSLILFNETIPKLNKFTSKVHSMIDNKFSIEDIKRIENIM